MIWTRVVFPSESLVDVRSLIAGIVCTCNHVALGYRVVNPLRLDALDASPFYLCSTFWQRGEVRFLTPLRSE